jgi:hypothetical protein
MKTKVIAVVLGTVPDRGDPTVCGEDIVLGTRDFPNGGLARKWVNEYLARPLAVGCLSQWGFMRKVEYDTVYGWLTVAESDTITPEECDRETKWFTVEG